MSCLSVEEWNYHAQVDPLLVQQVVQEVYDHFSGFAFVSTEGLMISLPFCAEVQPISQRTACLQSPHLGQFHHVLLHLCHFWQPRREAELY